MTRTQPARAGAGSADALRGGSPLVLASSSKTRAGLLKAVGLACAIEAPAVDEDAVKASLKAEGADAGTVAEALAELKARRVSARRRDALVVGADQVLQCEGQLYDKPATVAAARAQLQALRGRAHELLSAVVVVRADERLWHHTARARLVMRPFSDSFLDAYLARAGDDVCGSVGAYRLEGPAVQMFESIEGDYFAILGLPLLPLLDFLRLQGVIPS
jgi:septum formation protein